MKKIAGYENYCITEDGRVFNSRNRQMSPSTHRDGYLKVSLTNNGKQSTFMIHRLVASAFVDNPLNKPCVNHKDGNKQNNVVDNLEWVTHQENSLHSINVLGKGRLETHPRTKLTQEIVHDICKDMVGGKSNQYIIDKYDITVNTVCKIRKGRTWKVVSSGYEIPPDTSNLIPEEVVRYICKELSNGKTPYSIVKDCLEYNLGETSVWRIKNKERYKDISDEYF